MGTQDLIFSAANTRPLEWYEVTNKIGAYYTTNPDPRRSERYGMMSTRQADVIIQDRGWHPVAAKQVKARKLGGSLYGKHMIAYYNDQFPANEDGRPVLCLYNSHDSTSSFRLLRGWFRFVCSNGCIAGEGHDIRLRHSLANSSSFSQLLEEATDGFPKLISRIEAMRNTEVFGPEVEMFVAEALDTRWKYINYRKDDETGVWYDERTMQDTVKVRRPEDEGMSAWHIFNRVQETIINGRTTTVNFTPKKPYLHHRKPRPVTSVSETVRINQELWNLADQHLMAA